VEQNQNTVYSKHYQIDFQSTLSNFNTKTKNFQNEISSICQYASP